MIDFSQFNGVKRPVDVSTPFLKGMQDGEEIEVGPSAAFQSPESQQQEIMIQPDYVMPAAVVQPLSPNPIVTQPTQNIDANLVPRKALASDAPNPSGQESGGILGAVSRAILGGSGDESSLDPATQKEKQKKRKEAGNASASFANDPEAAAESFMKAPGTGGSSFGSTLGSLAKIFSGMGIG